MKLTIHHLPNASKDICQRWGLKIKSKQGNNCILQSNYDFYGDKREYIYKKGVIYGLIHNMQCCSRTGY